MYIYIVHIYIYIYSWNSNGIWCMYIYIVIYGITMVYCKWDHMDDGIQWIIVDNCYMDDS
jgi:hypothetical protein